MEGIGSTLPLSVTELPFQCSQSITEVVIFNSVLLHRQLFCLRHKVRFGLSCSKAYICDPQFASKATAKLAAADSGAVRIKSFTKTKEIRNKLIACRRSNKK